MGDAGPKGDTGPAGPPGPGNDARRVLQLAADTAEIFSVPFGKLIIDCNSSPPYVEFDFFNGAGASVNVFIADADGSLSFQVVDNGSDVAQDGDGTQRWTLQLSDGGNSAGIDIWLTGEGGGCNGIVHSDSDLPS